MVRDQRDPDDGPVRAERGPNARLHREEGVSAKKERERRREQRQQRESEAAENARRQRLIKLASAAAFLAIVAVAVAVVISQSGTSGGDTSLEDVAEVESD